MDLKGLKKTMPYKWRIQSINSYAATCVAYIDARDVMDILDEVVGAGNWQDSYEVIGGNLYCDIAINVGDGLWVSKTDCGTESKIEKEKGQSSDAFKRAAVKWGIGRFLYSLKIERLKVREHKGKFYPYAVENDKIIFDGDTLTKYITWKNEQK